MAERVSGGGALVAGLQRWGVDMVFGLPGVHLDHFFDALHAQRDSVRVLHTRHEQGAAYMAAGYAMATGRPGVFAVVPGPGLLNTTAALATAYACSVPVLCLTTTVWWPLIDRQYGALHEIPDQSGILRRLTKWTARVTHAAAIPEYVDEAFRQMLSGRPRPVALEIPPEVLGHTAIMPPFQPPDAPVPVPVDTDAIDRAAGLIAQSRHPLIVVGGGAQHAGAAVRTLAERIGAPVISRNMGRGVLDDRHELAVPAAAALPLWKRADVVIGIGTRLQQLREWGSDDQLQVVRIDVDPLEMHRLAAPAAEIIGDAGTSTAALCAALPGKLALDPGWRGEGAASTAALRAEIVHKLSPQTAWLAALRAAMPDDGIFVEDLTQVSYAARVDFPVYCPRGYICSGYEGTLGAGYATALGVQAGLPGRRVVSVNGDGGFMYNVQELASAVRHALPVVVLVFNDGRFGNVHLIQKNWYGERLIATDLHNPDFPAMAASFGVSAERIHEPAELGAALERAFAAAGPALIEIPFNIDDMAWPWDYLLPRPVRG